MNTALQLQSSPAMTCELLHGAPLRIVDGKLGAIALFGPDEIVAYVRRAPAMQTLVVFRTLAVDDALAASVPGVFPRVRLLMHLRSATRVRAALRLFAYARKRGIDASGLRDAFFVRLSIALGGRRVAQVHLRELLRKERSEGSRGGFAMQTGGRL